MSSRASIIGTTEETLMQFMKFHSVFDEKCENIDIFNGTAKLLCDNMIQTGFNSLLFAVCSIHICVACSHHKMYVTVLTVRTDGIRQDIYTPGQSRKK